MRVLVVGAGGAIGTWLVPQLLGAGPEAIMHQATALADAATSAKLVRVPLAAGTLVP